MKNKNEKKKMPLWIRLAMIIIILVTVLLCAAILNSDNASQTSTEKSINETNSSEQENSDSQQINKKIVESDIIDAEFIGFEDHPELEMFLVTLSVSNKTNQPIWVYMEDASVNDEMMQMVMTGVPLKNPYLHSVANLWYNQAS